jgi:hypothetical protein
MALSIFISGTEYRVLNDYQISEQSGAVSSSNFSVLLDDSHPPVSHELVEVYEGTLHFFTGIIQSVDFPEYSTQFETMVYNISVSSLGCILNNRLVNESYENMTTTEIVNDLFTNYLVEEGLTLGTIDDFTRNYESYTANRLKLSDVLAELGDAVQAIPCISANKVFSFVSRGSFNSFPVPTKLTKLKKSENGTQLRTVQFISGASENTGQQTKSITWATGQTEIVLAYQVARVVGVSINGVTCGVGLVGVDSDSLTKTFLWKYGQSTIALNTSATVQPAAGNTVVVVYYGYYSVEVQSVNESLQSTIKALNGTSGKIEVVNVDTTIITLLDGESVAQDLLTENGVREETVTCDCHSLTASTLLTVWRLDYPGLFITGDYVVVERSISHFDNDKKRISVTLKNKGFYSRYGTIFNKNQKTINSLTIRADDLVNKYSSVNEFFQFSDLFALDNAGVVYFPSNTGVFEPMIDGFYPI